MFLIFGHHNTLERALFNPRLEYLKILLLILLYSIINLIDLESWRLWVFGRVYHSALVLILRRIRCENLCQSSSAIWIWGALRIIIFRVDLLICLMPKSDSANCTNYWPAFLGQFTSLSKRGHRNNCEIWVLLCQVFSWFTWLLIILEWFLKSFLMQLKRINMHLESMALRSSIFGFILRWKLLSRFFLPKCIFRLIFQWGHFFIHLSIFI